MPSMGAEVLATVLAIFGWISAIVSCSLPMWKVSVYNRMKTVVTQINYDGIWMTCEYYTTSHFTLCKPFYSVLDLNKSHQAARALTVISIVAGALGLLAASVGAKCTRCVGEKAAKAQVMTAAGVIFVLAALAQIIPVSWYAHSVIVAYNDPGVPSGEKRDLGVALYLGWAAGALLLVGGVILCCSWPKAAEKRLNAPSVAMHAQKRPTSPSSYDKQDFV